MTPQVGGINAHPSCGTHQGRRLTCEEYDDLRQIMAGCCQMCGVRTDLLDIDHDHALGDWAVRGLLCGSCNCTLGWIEQGVRVATPESERYLAYAWHVRQESSAGKRRRAMRRAECPTCGVDTAIKKDGLPTVHWSRDPDRSDEICSGLPKPQGDPPTGSA